MIIIIITTTTNNNDNNNNNNNNDNDNDNDDNDEYPSSKQFFWRPQESVFQCTEWQDLVQSTFFLSLPINEL
jgi:hypothetical protein